MNDEEFKNLKVGDIVRGRHSVDAYVITNSNDIGSFMAVRNITVTNPREWILIEKEPIKSNGCQICDLFIETIKKYKI